MKPEIFVVDCDEVDWGNPILPGRSSRDERPSELRAGRNSVLAGTVATAFDGITRRAIFDRS